MLKCQLEKQRQFLPEVVIEAGGEHLLDQCERQALNVLPVQVCCWFIQGQYPTVETESFSQSQADDQ